MLDRSATDLLDIRLINADAAGMVLERIGVHGVQTGLPQWYGDEFRATGGIGRTTLKLARSTFSALAALAFATTIAESDPKGRLATRRRYVFFTAGLERGLLAVEAAEQLGQAAPTLACALAALEQLSPPPLHDDAGLHRLCRAAARLTGLSLGLVVLLTLNAHSADDAGPFLRGADDDGAVPDLLGYFYLLGMIGAGCRLRATSSDADPSF